MPSYLTNHLDLNPLAIAAFALIAFILVACSPVWTKRRRRARVLAERHGRVAEDRAWAQRDEDVELAGRLRFARFDQEQALGGHSVALTGREDDGLDRALEREPDADAYSLTYAGGGS